MKVVHTVVCNPVDVEQLRNLYPAPPILTASDSLSGVFIKASLWLPEGAGLEQDRSGNIIGGGGFPKSAAGQ